MEPGFRPAFPGQEPFPFSLFQSGDLQIIQSLVGKPWHFPFILTNKHHRMCSRRLFWTISFIRTYYYIEIRGFCVVVSFRIVIDPEAYYLVTIDYKIYITYYPHSQLQQRRCKVKPVCLNSRRSPTHFASRVHSCLSAIPQSERHALLQ